MADYQARLQEFASADTDVVAISVDDQARSERIRNQFGFAFPLLCDPSRAVTRAWGLYDEHDLRDIGLPATVLVERDTTLGLVAVEVTRKRLAAEDVLSFLQAAPGQPPPGKRLVAGPGIWWRAIWNVGRYGMKTARRPES